MRVAVTGVRGFIGGTLAPALRSRGHEVRDVPREALHLRDAYAACECVVHLANIAHAAASAAELQRVNVEGTLRVAELAAGQGVRRFVYLSSIKASGEETRGVPFDGTEAPSPGDAYGHAKLAAEKALADVGSRTGMKIVVFRPPLVYGPGVRGNFLALMRAIARGWPLPLAGIENRRSLVYSANLVDAIAKSAEAKAPGSAPYVICDGSALSTPALCRALGKALGKAARLVPFPAALLELLPNGRRLTRSLEVDDRLLRRELHWQPPFSAEEGLRLTAEWYRLESAP